MSKQTICFTDLLATFAAIVNVTLPTDAGPDSFDFSTVLLRSRPEDKPVRDSLAIRSGGGAMTIRSGDWKLITALGSGGFSKPRRIEPGAGDPQGQLYDLANDLGETKNLYAKEPEIVERLMKELTALRAGRRSRPIVK